MNIKPLLLVALLGTGPAAGAAGLFEVYQDALASDAKFAAAVSQYEAVAQRVPQARAALLPSLSVSGNSLRNDNDSNTPYADGVYNSYEYNANLTQPLLKLEASAAHAQARHGLRQAQAEFDLARQDLILRVSQAYFDVLLAEDNLRTVAAQRAAFAEQAASANRKFELGTASITDVRDTQARAQLAVAQEIAARAEIEAKREALRVLTGSTPGALAPLRAGTMPPAPESPAGVAGFIEQARTGSKLVEAGQAAVGVAEKEAEKARAGHYPTVDLVASYGESDSATTSTVGTEITGTTVGVQVNVPIYSGGAVMYREREARAMLKKAEADLESARRESVYAAQQAYLGLTAGYAQVAALEKALESARAAVDANKRGLEIGVRVDIDVLNAQQQMSATERDLARSRYDTLMALLKLKRAVGTLGEEDVRALAAYFDAP